MAQAVVENICYGNHGRTPIAHARIQQVFDDRGFTEYTASSSGTLVDSCNGWLLDKTIPQNHAKTLLKKGLERRIFLNPQNIFVEGLLQGETQDLSSTQAQSYAKQALQFFYDEEGVFRDEAFKRLGLRKIPEEPKQTVVRADTALILCVNRKLVDSVRGLYEGKGLNVPEVFTLEDFARLEYTGFEDAFCSTFDVYFEVAKRVDTCSRLAADRIIEETLR